MRFFRISYTRRSKWKKLGDLVQKGKDSLFFEMASEEHHFSYGFGRDTKSEISNVKNDFFGLFVKCWGAIQINSPLMDVSSFSHVLFYYGSILNVGALWTSVFKKPLILI